MKRRLALACFVLAVAGCGGSGGSLILQSNPPDVTNPSFETPAVPAGNFVKPGDPVASHWNGSGLWGMADGSGQWGTGAHSGAQYAFLQSFATESSIPGSISQSISGFGSGRFKVRFWMARRGGSIPTGSVPVSVYADGVQIMASTYPTDDFAWNQYTTDAFTPSSSTVVIELRSSSLAGDHATLLDDISIVAGN